MTPGQIKMVRGIIAKAGLTEFKEVIVASHTDGRTCSLTACTYEETQALVKYLNRHMGIPEVSPADKMRSKILSLAHEMKWHYPGTRWVDVPRVNRWLMGKGGFNDLLDDLNYIDLPKAVTAFERVWRDYLKRI